MTGANQAGEHSENTPVFGAPVFVVVGNVNQGKSSVVAALTEDASVPIARYPGTTQRCAEYAFQLGGRVVFRIMDSPGFQNARRALAWMKERAATPDQRLQAVRAFVDAHRGGEEFADEVELLQPILDGGGILYVVDASGRFQPSNEAEMEILRWTGQPAMALLNRTRDEVREGEWRPLLNQFFNLVREFDAQGARFADRVELLRGFREVRKDWQPAMDRAIAAMQQEWEERGQRASAVIADFLTNALAHVEKQSLREGEGTSDHKVALTGRYQEHLRAREKEARAAVERIYGHAGVDRTGTDLDLLSADLFSEESWKMFGLTRSQLVQSGAVSGALIGGGFDLVVGGASFMLGAAVGAGIGAVSGWFGPKVADTWGQNSKLAAALFPGDTGRFLCVGPATNPGFAWVLTDRSLLHWAVVRDRAHSRRDALNLAGDSDGASGKQGVASALPPERRQSLDKALAVVAKDAKRGRVTQDARDAMVQAIAPIVGG